MYQVSQQQLILEDNGAMLSENQKDICLNLILDPAIVLINYKETITAYTEKQRLKFYPSHILSKNNYLRIFCFIPVKRIRKWLEMFYEVVENLNRIITVEENVKVYS